MRKASIRDLRTRTSALLRDAENGETIIIERRGVPVAELGPLTKRRKKLKLPDMSRFWNEFPQVPGESSRFIEEDRDRLTVESELRQNKAPGYRVRAPLV